MRRQIPMDISISRGIINSGIQRRNLLDVWLFLSRLMKYR